MNRAAAIFALGLLSGVAPAAPLNSSSNREFEGGGGDGGGVEGGGGGGGGGRSGVGIGDSRAGEKKALRIEVALAAVPR